MSQECKKEGRPYGVRRVLEPAGALPQAAARLDTALPLYDNEILLEVQTLNLDSASFRQMLEVAREKGAADVEKRLAEGLLANVRQRGKQVNPVTGSGGMLLGRVKEIGPHYANPLHLAVGDRVATLVSLTLTPLVLDEVTQVHIGGPREAQIDVRGRAMLASEAPIARLPADLPDRLVLSVLDVCGAPAQVARLAQKNQRIVVIGAGGKSGLLCLAELRRKLGSDIKILAVDASPGGIRALERLNAADAIVQADARAALEVAARVSEWSKGAMADLVINTANVAHTEMACILSARVGGIVYFFNMATDFSRATLGAEGAGRDVTLMMGNGFVPGHAELALRLVRENDVLRDLLEGVTK